MQYKYTPYFCEENIWLLGKDLIKEKNSIQNLFVLFLSNSKKVTPLFCQKKANGKMPVFWDYHVILLNSAEKIIFDFDTTLPFPCPYQEYIHNTFPDLSNLSAPYQTYIRFIPLDSYHKHFHSDRSHMLRKGKPIKPFPNYPPILAENFPITIADYSNMKKELKDGSKIVHYTSIYNFIP